MKRTLFSRTLKPTMLAVPAAALMLGAAQAGTTIGLNFQSWYYDSGTTPQTIGYGQGYQTTGFPATARAFGLDVANWINTDPLPASAVDTVLTLDAAISAHVTTVNMWQSDIGNLVDPANEWTPGYSSSVSPGNDEVTWSFEDNTGWTNTLSGLSTTFPNGCVLELIGVAKCTTSSRVVLEQGGSTITNAFEEIYTAGNDNFSGPVGMMAITVTNDAITFGAASRNINSAESCAIAGFILTDQPVISRDPQDVSVNQGATLTLTARTVGLEPLSYQWQHAGTNVTGATTVPYSKTATAGDEGSWVLVATNAYGATTSEAATVTVYQAPSISSDLSTTTNTVYAGLGKALVVIAGGAEPLSYQWMQDGVAIPGATNSTYAASSSTPGISGYNVVVTNSFGSIISQTNYLDVVATPDAYTDQVASDAPVSFWALDETTGDLVKDYAGFGHDGVNSNSLTLGVAGPKPPTFPGLSASKTAYQFDGYNFVDLETGPALSGTTDFTLEAWVKTTSTTMARLIQQRSGYVGEYMLDINESGNVVFTIYGSGGYQFGFSSSTSINDGNWHHIAAVRSGEDGFIYIDGALAAQASGTVIALDPTYAVALGADLRDFGTSPKFYIGQLCDVAIYDKALTSSQIITHYTTATGIELKLELVAGGIIEDSKPSGTPHPGFNHGTTWVDSSTDLNFPAVTRTGVQQFSTAASSQIRIPADPDFDSTTGTICFWMRFDAVTAGGIPGPGNEAAILMDRRTSAGAVIALNDAGEIFVQCAGNPRGNSLSAGYLPDDLWHHVAVTYDQSASGSVAIYIDGVLQLSNPNAAEWSWPADQPIELGRSHDSYWKRFDGQMDDFRIYNRVLSDTEIGQVFSSDTLVDASALKVQYDFGTAGGGQSIVWPFGTLESSPTLGPGAIWTPVPGALSPWPFLPTEPSEFFRVQQ